MQNKRRSLSWRRDDDVDNTQKAPFGQPHNYHILRDTLNAFFFLSFFRVRPFPASFFYLRTNKCSFITSSKRKPLCLRCSLRQAGRARIYLGI